MTHRRRFRLPRRRIILVAAVWLIAVVGPLIVTSLQVRMGNLRELRTVFGLWDGYGASRTVVVFAPHCDDEILGAGGLMRQLAESGAQVWVVLMTNGDGFRYAATLDNRSFRIRPKDYIDFGYKRQQETSAALGILGIARHRMVTLGYPDRGLEAMWVSNWDRPYTSPWTKDSISPYVNSFTANAPYTGSQLLSDLKTLLRDIDPDAIYMPHPNDQHSDHWATSVFVTEALYELGWLRERNVGLYLIHRGDWPVPQGLHESTDLAPPAKLADMDTRWREFPLSTETVRLKGQAVGEFRSQTAAVRRFLRSFVRRNELFGTRNPEAWIAKSSDIRIDGRVDDWRGIAPIIRDPADDGLVTHSRPGGDLTAIYAARDSRRLYFRISTRGVIKKPVNCELMIHTLGGKEGTTRIVLKRGKELPPGWAVEYGKRDIEVSCPLGRWRHRPLMVAADTAQSWYQIDRSAYRILLP